MFRILLTEEGKLLLRRRKEDARDMLPLAAGCDYAGTAFREEGVYRYMMDGSLCEARRAPAHAPGLRSVGLRECWHQLNPSQYRMVCKGVELLNHDSATRFCGRCGGELRRAPDGLSKRCECCGAEVWPHVSPCVIVLVTRGDKALLVHARTFRGGHYGLVAGFLETGETVEDCVRREVLEETSLHVRNVHYIGSQPWPFPANLMLAFTAEYESGTLRFADGELTRGGFFGRDELPQLPVGASIARLMIERWKRGDICGG